MTPPITVAFLAPPDLDYPLLPPNLCGKPCTVSASPVYTGGQGGDQKKN